MFFLTLDWRLLFDFETDPQALGAERLKRLGLLGIAVGVPAALMGLVLTFALVNWTGRVGKWTMLPGGIGIIVLATGLYRLAVGFVPIIARTRLLRMLVMLLLLVVILVPIGYALLAE